MKKPLLELVESLRPVAGARAGLLQELLCTQFSSRSFPAVLPSVEKGLT